jgi:hypothetical protein
VTAIAGTLSAFCESERRVITFTDYVRDGETIAVYRTMEAAEEERGAYRMMRVRWEPYDADGGEWFVEPLGPGATT